jgi:S-adenosylmethionine:tRNA ribosyltransferase-isomerase
MRRADFSYPLPAELIADRPLPRRGASRLLALDGESGALRDLAFDDLRTLLRPGDLLVLNDTRVLPARLRGRKASGGACEILLERLLGGGLFLAQGRASKGFAAGTRIALPAGASAVVVGRRGEFHEFELDREALPYFEAHGSVPLPPYLAREAEPADRERYQTVYAAVPGAVAAPTAGLHFEAEALEKLERDCIGLARVTLHVGAGTFTPMRADVVEEHRMHAERIRVPGPTVAAIDSARARGGRIVAVGTTVLRTLETVAQQHHELAPASGETRLFITPGYRFRTVDLLLTNFHLPRSTLFMLVAAFAGLDRIRAAYAHAIRAGYRFYSYGDAGLLERVGAD